MNRVVLMGRLTRDPDIRYSQGENPMCIARYTLAVDRRFSRSAGNNNDGNNADFISCVAFGRSGEFAEKYLRKGTKICLSGRIQTGSYTNRDGVKVYTTEVVAEDQEFAESRNAAAQNGGGYSDQRRGGYNNGGSGNYNNGGNSGNYNSGNSAGNYNGGSAGNSGNYGGNASQAPQQGADEAAIDGFMNIPDGIDEELPFA